MGECDQLKIGQIRSHNKSEVTREKSRIYHQKPLIIYAFYHFNCRPSHAPFFEHLQADKMAVVTMHNLMGLLMINNGGAGAVKVVQPACAIGEALENEVKIHRLLEKTKKKSIAIKKPEAESDTMTYEQETLTKELEQEKLTKEQRPSYIVYQIAK